MILRAAILAAGLAGAFSAAQFPAFSQQYLQRLGGAVDALGTVVADFDASAAAEGLSRSEALAQMRGSAFVDRRRADMARTFERHVRLQADLAALQGQGPFMRAYRVAHLTDGEIARRAWQAFQPSVPLNVTTLLFGTFGFLVSSALVSLLFSVLRWPMRRRPMAA